MALPDVLFEGYIVDALGVPVANKTLEITPVAAKGAGGYLEEIKTVKPKTDAVGFYSFRLATVPDGFIRYKYKSPFKEHVSYPFDNEPTEETRSLDDAIAAGLTSQPPTTYTYINTKVAEATTDERLTELIEPVVEEYVTDEVIQTAFGYTPENTANKATDFSTVNNTKFPTVQASKTYADAGDAATITTLRDGVAGAGDTLAKLYTLFTTLNSIVTSTTPDGDAFTDTIQEVLSIFSTYPEGADIAQALAGKIDTSAILNALTETASGKVLDARQGKALKDLIDALTTTVSTNTTSIASNTSAITSHTTSLALLNGAMANVKSNGALGDGTTDDRAAIQTTINAVSALGGGIVFLPAGTYLIKRALFLPSKVTLMGAGRGATKITKPASIKSLLTANASTSATSVTVADSTGFEVGGAIHLYDTSSYEWASTQGRITNIAGNVITFADDEGLGRTGLNGNLLTSRTATATTSFPLIRNVVTSTNVTVRDLTLDQNKNANDPGNTVYDFTLGAIHWVETYYSLVENVEILNAVADAYSDQAQDGTSITVSASLIKTTKNTIRNCRIRDANRHAVHLGTCMRGAFVLHNEITNCAGFGVFYCAFATNTVAMGNIVEGCGSGFAGIDDRDFGNVIANNQVTNWTTYAIEGSNAGSGATGAEFGKCTITGNVLTDTTTGGGSGIYWNQPEAVIANNYIAMVSGGHGIRLGSSAHRSTVSSNVVTGGGAGSTGLTIEFIDDLRIYNNVFRGMPKGVSIVGCTRMVASGNHFSTITNNAAWVFETSASTDCVIKDERNTVNSPVTESVAPVRLVYEGLGTNGSADPASSGAWNGISGKRFNGQMVRWDSGGGEKISIFYQGVGWTTLN